MIEVKNVLETKSLERCPQAGIAFVSVYDTNQAVTTGA